MLCVSPASLILCFSSLQTGGGSKFPELETKLYDRISSEPDLVGVELLGPQDLSPARDNREDATLLTLFLRTQVPSLFEPAGAQPGAPLRPTAVDFVPSVNY